MFGAASIAAVAPAASVTLAAGAPVTLAPAMSRVVAGPNALAAPATPMPITATLAAGASEAAGSVGAAGSAGSAQLIGAAVAGIAVIIIAITVLKVHPFLALLVGSFAMALLAGTPLPDSLASFTSGLGDTVGGVGVLIVLGSMIGELLIRTGGADRIVDTVIGRAQVRSLPWAMALVAGIIGIPMFFEVGVVLIIPVAMLVARKMRLPALLIGLPALAGLSVLHCFVPPHPGPLIAIDAVGANLGITLALGLIVAIPTVIVSGPVLAKQVVRWVPVPARELLEDDREPVPEDQQPSFAASITIVVIPVALMLAEAIVTIFGWQVAGLTPLIAFAGQPIIALLAAVFYGAIVLGYGQGKNLEEVSGIIGKSFAPIASILVIVGAGGGFKQTLVDSGIADVLGNWLAEQPISPLLAGWLIAVAIRVATGSATVATITAAGLAAPLAAGMGSWELALMVLAVGAGSNFCSHVNDAGFWLVKEYFGLTVAQTFKSWSVLTTTISVMGLFLVLALSVVV